MTDDEYIGFALNEINEKYLLGESSEAIYAIVFSLFNSVYYQTEEEYRLDVKNTIMGMIESIDKGELDEFIIEHTDRT